MLTGGRARRLVTRDDDGQIAILVLGCAVIAAVLILVGIAVTKVLLAQRSLASAADAAALAATDGVDRSALYDGSASLTCGAALPLDPAAATRLAGGSLDAAAPALAGSVRDLAPAVSVAGGTVTVTLRARVSLPMGGVLALLDPALHDGTAGVTATSSAQAPVTGC